MNETSYIPKVGDGATVRGWSDRYACTIIEVSKSGKSVKIQRDKATLLNGPDSGEPDALKVYPGGFAAHVSGTQRYSYEPDPEGVIYEVSYRKPSTWNADGCWVIKGESVRGGRRVTMGQRYEYYDYNF